jgi:hypothetical protein
MSILINIASEFTGKKAFDKAEKSTKRLDLSVKKLGKSLGIALSVGAVTAFGKASVRAFAEAEKANVRLAKSIENLGLGFATKQIQANLDKISASSGIAGETLVQAFQPLISVTGSVTKSLELLNLALDVSASTGVDLATVTQDLANAYVGNVKGLKKYNLGLAQAELTTMSFADIQKKLTNQFKGSNAAYLETYAGKMQVLAEAAGRAQETIGKGLIDALMAITGSTDIQDLISDIDTFAEDLAATLVEVGKLIKPIVDTLKGLIGLLKQGGTVDVNVSPAEQFRQEMNKRKPIYGPENVVTAYQNAAAQRKSAAAAAKAEADAAKRAKQLLALQQKQLMEQKKQAALKKAQGIFDLDKIQVIAALQGKISEDEKLRLQLQLALLQGNEEYAKKLSEQLALSQYKTQGLAFALADLPKDINPFKAWILDLDLIEAKLRALNLNPGGGTPSPSPSGNVPKLPIASPDLVMAQASADFAAANNTIRLIVEGGDEVTNLMRFKIQEAAQSGSTTNWSQTVGAYDR